MELANIKRADIRPQTHLPSRPPLTQKDLTVQDQGEDHLNNDHVENMDTAREHAARSPASPSRLGEKAQQLANGHAGALVENVSQDTDTVADPREIKITVIRNKNPARCSTLKSRVASSNLRSAYLRPQPLSKSQLNRNLDK